MKTLSLYTGTKNLFINSLIVTALLLISVSLIGLIFNCIIDPSLIANASF